MSAGASFAVFHLGMAACLLAPALPSAASAQVKPPPFTSSTRYDAGRRVVGTIAADPGGGAARYQAVRNSYDAAGRLIRVEQGHLQDWQSDAVAPAAWPGFTSVRVVETRYDAMGRKASEAVKAGSGAPAAGTILSFRQWSYDADGRPECEAVRMNPASFGSTATGACSPTAAGSFGPDRITRNLYDAAGQLVKVQKAYGTPLQQDYASYEYTPNGKRKAVIDANGNRAEMGWDGHDRQASWVFPHPSATGQVNGGDYEAYGYDANGNRTSLRKRDGRTIAYGYDALNRLTSKTYPQGGARGVWYGYDLRGLQTAARYDGPGGGDAVLTAYTGFGEIASSTTAMAGVSRTLGYLYDADGNRVRVTHPDGQGFRYTYDALGRATFANQLADGIGLQLAVFDAAGRQTRRIGVQTLGHDGIGRTASVSASIGAGSFTVTLGYNPAGQIVERGRDNDAYAFTGYFNISRGYTRNGLNQYTGAGSASFGYDANGNLTGDGTRSYGYDIENRLVSVSNGATLAWDPTGRLWQVAGPVEGTTQFLYDGDRLSVEYGASGTVLRRYLHGNGADDPLFWYEGPDATIAALRGLIVDHQGSVVSVMTNQGQILATNRYDEYGIPPMAAGGGANANIGRFQYTGQAWLPDIGMYHYKARIYSPYLGRFLQTDPIGYDDQVNLYAYVGNDPVNGRDPTGRSCVSAVFSTGGRAPTRTTTTYCNNQVSAAAFRLLSVVGLQGMITRTEEASTPEAAEDPRSNAERSRDGKTVITGDQKPDGKLGIDNRGKGRSVQGVIGDAAAEAGVKPTTTKDGKPMVVFPDGTKAIGYDNSATTDGPTIKIQGSRGNTIVGTREDFMRVIND